MLGTAPPPPGTSTLPTRTDRTERKVIAWMQVLAQRKVKKTQQVILKEDVPNIGKKGELTNVINGYWCASLACTLLYDATRH